MVERQHRPPLNLYVARELSASDTIELPDAAANHARVRRVEVGEGVRLTDGRGAIAIGVITSITKSRIAVAVDHVARVAAPPAMHLLVPVADRDRMLMAAEKCTELQMTSWRPVLWARSRSVSPRGEGEKFREKVTARMIAALEQSGGAWLPEIWPESAPDAALQAALDIAARFILDPGGDSLPPSGPADAVALAVGPEGGFEDTELALAASFGWRRLALGTSTLRFETALIAGAAVVRARQQNVRS